MYDIWYRMYEKDDQLFLCCALVPKSEGLQCGYQVEEAGYLNDPHVKWVQSVFSADDFRNASLNYWV